MSTSGILRLYCQSCVSIKFCSNPLGVFGLRLSFPIWVILLAEMVSSLTLQRCSLWSTGLLLLAYLRFCNSSASLTFFIKFTRGYANLTKPLTDLSKKDVQFDWTPSRKSTFNALKQALSFAPVLASPDPNNPFELVCDASGFGLGAVLLQEGRPLSYYSQKMTAAERNYVVTEQEVLAAGEALRVFRCYLLSGKQFNLVTDNRPNTFLQTQPILSRRQPAGVSTCSALI